MPITKEDELLNCAAEADLDEAEMDPNPDTPAGHNRPPFRGYIANLHIQYVLIY